MNAIASDISLTYGDAEFSFWDIHLVTDITADNPSWHRHRYYEAHICRRGTTDYHIGDNDVTLAAGQILIIPPNASHVSIDRSIYSEDDIFVLSFELKRVKSDKRFFHVFSEALARVASVPISVNGITKLELEHFHNRTLYRTIKGACFLTSIASKFIDLLFHVIVSDENNVLFEKKETDFLIDCMINTSNITLDDIAKATNYSKRHVSRLIKAKYGASLGALKKQRMQEDSSK